MANTIAENIAAKKAREAGTSTASVEVLLGSGAVKINQATAGLKGATEAINSLVETLNGQVGELSLKVAAGEARLADIDDEATEKKRRNKVEVELDFQANQSAAAEAYATKSGLVLVSGAEKARQEQEYLKLNENFEKEVSKRVAIETSNAKRDAEFSVKLAEADYKTKESSNIATIDSLRQQLAAANTTIEQLRADATAVREAEVKRAQAGSIQNLNVGNAPR